MHRLTVNDVSVDGSWSISVYNAAGFFEKNALGKLLAQQPDRGIESGFVTQFARRLETCIDFLEVQRDRRHQAALLPRSGKRFASCG